MGITSDLDHFIREFVLSYHNEIVHLDLGPPITIHHITKKGSTILGLFWANILQAESNFPKSKFYYENVRDSVSGSKHFKLKLQVDNVTITVCMKTGKLMIDGYTAHEWFSKKFRGVLERYEEPEGEIPTHEDYADPGYARAVNPNAHLLETETKKILERAMSCDEKELEKCGGELVAQCRGGTVLAGTSAYDACLHLVEKWLRRGDLLYVASPHLDIGRMIDLSDLVLQNRLTCQIEAVYVSYQCSDTHSGNNIKRQTLQHFTDATDKLLIEYKLLERMRHPAANFEVTFVAGVSAERAEVMVLGGALVAKNVLRDTMLFASVQDMVRDEFLDKFVKPLQSAVL